MKLEINIPANLTFQYPTISLIDLLKEQIKDDNSISVNNKNVIDSLLIVIKDIVSQDNCAVSRMYDISKWSNKSINVSNTDIHKSNGLTIMTDSNYSNY